MANLNETKEKVMTTIGTVADMTKDFAAQIGDKAKGMARIAKLTIEINNEKETIKKAYSEIGKLYYETHRDNPEGFFTQLCEEITLAGSGITDREDEIAAIKAEMKEKGEGDPIEVEFEEVVSEAECGCDHDHHEHGHEHAEGEECGCCSDSQEKTPVGKVADAVAGAAREVADAVKEAYKDITEKRDDNE